jgi:hypothetical protein
MSRSISAPKAFPPSHASATPATVTTAPVSTKPTARSSLPSRGLCRTPADPWVSPDTARSTGHVLPGQIAARPESGAPTASRLSDLPSKRSSGERWAATWAQYGSSASGAVTLHVVWSSMAGQGLSVLRMLAAAAARNQSRRRTLQCAAAMTPPAGGCGRGAHLHFPPPGGGHRGHRRQVRASSSCDTCMARF